MKININVPDGISGNWKVESFSVSEEASKFQEIRSLYQLGRGRLSSGDYKSLKRNGSIIMSNTPDEIRDFIPFLSKAHGDILINGLGLGVLVCALISKGDVNSITVIEKSKDVIKLVGDTYLTDKRVSIINADSFEYKPPLGVKYNYVWHDIWDHITSYNLPEMHKLHRKYGRRCDYQESWCRHECEHQRKYDQRYGY